ncbi:MAG TPA: hypothetical protein DEP23_00590 [Ruminococcaceae bacterium]|nr:hypothetical protein [Oscillospiraceae bacterium]
MDDKPVDKTHLIHYHRKDVFLKTAKTDSEADEDRKAFADSILLQCQRKGYTVAETNRLISQLQMDLNDIQTVQNEITRFRCEF